MKKFIFSVLGFGLGIFMLFNSYMSLNRYINGYKQVLQPFEWAFSSAITCLVGVVLIIWTILLLKRRS